MKALAIFGGVVLLAVIYMGSLLGYREDCVNAEAELKAQHGKMKSKDAERRLTILDMAQVDRQYDAQFAKVWEEANEGRYGDNGSQAVMQWITEQNPNLPTNLKEKLMTVIEAKRAEFNAEQVNFLSRIEAYEKIWNGNRSLFVGMWFDFPSKDVIDLKIVTTSATERSFETGVDEGGSIYGNE